MHEGPAGAEPPQRLSQPATEYFVGGRDLTRWSRIGGWFVGLILRLSRYVSANTVLVVTSAIGAGLVTLLTWASAEIYEDVKDSDGLSNLDVPVLNLAISLRIPQNVAFVQFFTDLGGALKLTIITVVIVTIMVIRWHSRTPLMLMAIGASGSLLMTVVGKQLVGRARPPGVRGAAVRNVAVLSQRSHPQQHRHREPRRLPPPAAPDVVDRADPVRRPRRRLVRRHGPKPRLPGIPLADRRPGRLDARARLGSGGDHLPPALPHPPANPPGSP